MQRPVIWRLIATALCGLYLIALPPAAAPDVGNVQHPHFPKPVVLAPNVAFWKQIYTEHSVGDFVLHDRDNLGVIYDIVRVDETTNQARAEQLAKPEIQRVRAKYQEILLRLAEGPAPEELGAKGAWWDECGDVPALPTVCGGPPRICGSNRDCERRWMRACGGRAASCRRS